MHRRAPSASRSPGGLGLVGLAALALLALAIPAAASGPGPAPAGGGPTVSSITVNPNPVVPPAVAVTALAQEPGVLLDRAELWIDTPGFDGTSIFHMYAADGAWNSDTEAIAWTGAYSTFTLGLGPGPHTVLVHAHGGGTWGPFAAASFLVGSAQTVGPAAYLLEVSPADLPTNGTLRIDARFTDPFGAPVQAAEVFFDRLGPDGTGSPMTGAFGAPSVTATWADVLALPPGNHTVWVHGSNGYVWGPPVSGTFTARAPALTLSMAADATEAVPGQVVTYNVTLENHGNANATVAWLNVTLPEAVTYVGDTLGGTGTSYTFADVPFGSRSFEIQARVRADATDGRSLAASATLTYANELGSRFPPVAATTAGAVLAPELAVSLTGPATAHAGDLATFTVRLVNSGVRTIPDVVVSLDPASAVVVSDTAAAAGGQPLGGGRWRFPAFAPTTEAFDFTERIPGGVVDGADLARAVSATYVARLGTPAGAVANLTVPVGRPSFTLYVAPDRSDVNPGDRVSLTLAFENRGSVAAKDVTVRLRMPGGLAIAGGDPPTATDTGSLTWVLANVGRGSYDLAVVLEGRAPGTYPLEAELAYSSTGGAPLAAVSAATAIVVLPPEPVVPPGVVGVTATGSALALALFAATERGKTALLFLFVPLYTRLRHERVLDHETRGMIRGYILANPGDHYNSIKEALELPNGTLAYHIQVLEKESLVRSVKDGKFRRFYPYEMRVPESGAPTRIQKHLLDLIRANPGIKAREAAALLGLTSSTVSYHLERLDELHLIESHREGISKRLYVKGDLDLPT